ncbi:MAG: translation initiation factor, partial [Calditrichaeota bacterium]|nr:translation initiation factor [Calditrichota bacterium]
MSKQKRNIVYSTDPDWKNRDSIEEDEANSNEIQGTVYIRRETKGRGGKTVTIVKG